MSNDGISAEQLKQINRMMNDGHIGQPVNLSIKAFKRYIDSEFPGIKRSDRSYLINKYKAEAWSDYDEVVKFKLAEPTRRTHNKEKNGK